MAGLPADLAGVLAAAGSLPVIEDVAHAFPSPVLRTRRAVRRDDRSGRGVQLLCHQDDHDRRGRDARHRDDGDLADRARTMRLHGIGRDAWKRYTAAGSWYYEIEAAGFKDNLTDLAAAIGLVQLDRAAELRAARASIAARYRAGLADLAADGRLVLPHVGSGDEHAWHLFVVRLGDAARAVGRDRPGTSRCLGLPPGLQGSPRAEHAPSTPATGGHRDQRALHPAAPPSALPPNGVSVGQFPEAEAAYAGAISLPIWPGMTDSDVERTIEALKRAIVD